jgi:hypothetical protein
MKNDQIRFPLDQDIAPKEIADRWVAHFSGVRRARPPRNGATETQIAVLRQDLWISRAPARGGPETLNYVSEKGEPLNVLAVPCSPFSGSRGQVDAATVEVDRMPKSCLFRGAFVYFHSLDTQNAGVVDVAVLEIVDTAGGGSPGTNLQFPHPSWQFQVLASSDG